MFFSAILVHDILLNLGYYIIACTFRDINKHTFLSCVLTVCLLTSSQFFVIRLLTALGCPTIYHEKYFLLCLI